MGVMLALLLCISSDASAKARVFLLAGQSNMSGAGLYDKLKPSQKKPPEGVKIWNNNQWQDVGPGVSANKGRFGPELAFGRAMRKAFPTDQIYLIKTAAGGTSMFKHWHVENGGGAMLKRFRSRARAALKNLDDNKVQYTIAGMLWMQGESDAAQESVAKELKNVVCFNTDNFERLNKGHYNHNGQIELGNTFAQHFLSMVQGNK